MNEDPLRLVDRSFVVAGAGGGGIGTSICAAIVGAGGRVIAIDNDAERLAMADALGDAVTARLADVRDPLAIDGVLADVGSLHGLVHVAGGLSLDEWGHTEQLSLDTFDDVIILNLRAAFVTSRAVADKLIAVEQGGSIVYLSSIAALSALPYGAAYAVAKAGVLALMRTQAVEWGPLGIRVNAVAAGSVATPKSGGASPDDTTADATVPLLRRAVPDDVAGAALFLLSDLASYVNGHTLVVDGGSSVRPSFLDEDDLPVFVRDASLRSRLKE